MKLHYFHGRTPLRSLVLLRGDGRRVELHIRSIGDERWALLALSGVVGSQPEKHWCRGPFRTTAQGEAALRELAGDLLERDYQPQPEDHVVWLVAAQKLSRNLRIERDAGGNSLLLDPDQYEPVG